MAVFNSYDIIGNTIHEKARPAHGIDQVASVSLWACAADQLERLISIIAMVDLIAEESSSSDVVRHT